MLFAIVESVRLVQAHMVSLNCRLGAGCGKKVVQPGHTRYSVLSARVCGNSGGTTESNFRPEPNGSGLFS